MVAKSATDTLLSILTVARTAAEQFKRMDEATEATTRAMHRFAQKFQYLSENRHRRLLWGAQRHRKHKWSVFRSMRWEDGHNHRWDSLYELRATISRSVYTKKR